MYNFHTSKLHNQAFLLLNLSLQNTMKAAALIFVVSAFASSCFARPPLGFESDEYVDNNVVNSLPVAEHDAHTFGEEEEDRSEYVEM
jgi:hypothetical protein